ncbi:ATP phosphoribosyltransferase regulatory subunit [Staphylococcus gallinarum]|uniref:ATP phosphoribosyltransferase regulatory subunit n=1 Tax=Staphylococcus gallinarum TaxID=1293 RepID=UPI001E2CDE4F|nr:ATP phosphoribosyltransferase regulatory subunit [Staphylococcus gallinarum]MCD8857876.1 ATP phosphoribosyltransferase regulatory subunit [Staphylococcus gallinarum]
MNTTALIKKKEYELSFLKHFQDNDFNLVDFSFIESLSWQSLTKDDLQQMTERSFWQHDHHIYALRNDFTDQLLRYYSNYPPQYQRVAYTGPIVRDNEVYTQLGIEHYNPTVSDMQDDFLTFYKFIQTTLNDDIDFVILGHYQLIDLLLSANEQTQDILNLIQERNISELTTQLGSAHPVVQLLTTKTTEQLNLLSQLFPYDHKTIQALRRWEQWFKSNDITNIHLDITPQPPRSYYKGAFMRCHLKNNKSQQLTGGFYKGELEGFGLGFIL